MGQFKFSKGSGKQNSKMKAFLVTVVVISVYLISDAEGLLCTACSKASSLDDCNHKVQCGANEMCYMDEVITEQLTVQYNGGCRARDVCGSAASSTGPIGRRKRELIACSRCCDFDEKNGKACNSKLCGIKSSAINSSQCYFCDHRDSDQSEVTKPEDCLTLATCQHNEMCFVQQQNLAGRDSFLYGCYSEKLCVFLMGKVFEEMAACYGPNPDKAYCQGLISKRSTNLCNVCCADGGCNYGSCQDIKLRLWNLYNNGVFDPATLTQNGTLPTIAPAGANTTVVG